MPHDAQFDVFLSHSSKDKPVVRELAERLRQDGLRVWFDEWEIGFGDSIPSKIDEGLTNSRILIFCMSAHAFGSDWATLEHQAVRFRDPLNRARRFIPLRLDDATVNGSLEQFKYVDWREPNDETYRSLLAACVRPVAADGNNVQESGVTTNLNVPLATTGQVPTAQATPDQVARAATLVQIANSPADNVEARIVQTKAAILAYLHQKNFPAALDLPFAADDMPQELADIFNAVTPSSTRVSVADQCLIAISQLAKTVVEKLRNLPATVNPVSAEQRTTLRAAFINAMQQAILLTAREDKLQAARIQAAYQANSAQALDVNLWLSVSVLMRDELAQHVRADFPPGKLAVFRDKHQVNLFDEIELGTSENRTAPRKDLPTMAKIDRQGAETAVCQIVWNALFPGEAPYSSELFDVFQGELREMKDNDQHLLVIMEPQNGQLSGEFVDWLNGQMHLGVVTISTRQGLFDLSEGTWRAKLATLYKTLQPLEPTNRAAA